MEFSIWYPVYRSAFDPATAGEYPLLENLQQPGVRVAYFVAGIIWRFVEPHWSTYPAKIHHMILSVFAYLASAIAILFLIAMWSVIALALLWFVRLIRSTGERISKPGLITAGAYFAVAAGLYAMAASQPSGLGYEFLPLYMWAFPWNFLVPSDGYPIVIGIPFNMVLIYSVFWLGRVLRRSSKLKREGYP